MVWLFAALLLAGRLLRYRIIAFFTSLLARNDSQGLAVFFDTSQLEVIKVLIEQEVGRISSHGLGTMGMDLSLRRWRDRAARVRPRADLGAW